MKIALGYTSITLAVAIGLTACGSGSAGSPAVGIGQSSTAARTSGEPAPRNYSGDYAGTVKDSLYNKGSIKATFAQYQTAVGGSMTQDEISRTGTMTASFGVTAGTTLTGTAVEKFGVGTSSTACVYTIGGTYNAATHRLRGSYQAVHNCSGETGTFTMKQKCFYPRPGADADVGGLKMC
jgi:hypothetical protein